MSCVARCYDRRVPHGTETGAPRSGEGRGPGELRSHWDWRPEWTPGRVNVWWYLTLENVPELAAVASGLAPRLEHPLLDVIPAQWLHVTLAEVGYSDELRQGAVARLVEVTRSIAECSVAPPRIELGPLDAIPDAVVMRAGPASRLDALRRLLSTTSRSERPKSHPGDPIVFIPHVSLAYPNGPCDATKLLQQLPQLPLIKLGAPTLTLAAVTRRDRHYEWRALAAIA